MKQLSLFNDMPEKRVAVRKPREQQLSMFNGGELFDSRQTRADCPGNRLFDLVLAHPDETEEEAQAREARERTINMESR